MSVSQITNSLNASAPHSAHAVTTDVLDFEVLRAFEKVKSDDGSDIVVELIDLYLNGTSRRIAEMRNAADECDWAFLKRTAHTLKGSSSTLGLRQMAKICQDLEAASPSSAPDANAAISLLESRFLEASPVLMAERNRRLRLSH